MYEVAYDLSAFVPKTEEEHDKELKASSLRLIKIAARKKPLLPSN